MDIRGWAQGSIGSNRRKLKKKEEKKKDRHGFEDSFHWRLLSRGTSFAVILGYLFHLWLSARSRAHEKKRIL